MSPASMIYVWPSSAAEDVALHQFLRTMAILRHINIRITAISGSPRLPCYILYNFLSTEDFHAGLTIKSMTCMKQLQPISGEL